MATRGAASPPLMEAFPSTRRPPLGPALRCGGGSASLPNGLRVRETSRPVGRAQRGIRMTAAGTWPQQGAAGGRTCPRRMGPGWAPGSDGRDHGRGLPRLKRVGGTCPRAASGPEFEGSPRSAAVSHRNDDSGSRGRAVVPGKRQATARGGTRALHSLQGSAVWALGTARSALVTVANSMCSREQAGRVPASSPELGGPAPPPPSPPPGKAGDTPRARRRPALPSKLRRKRI